MADQSNPLLANLPSQGVGVTSPPDPNLVAPEIQPQPQQMSDFAQRPLGTGIAEQPQQPSDRKEYFRNMLSNFLYSFAAGAANSGTGPGANVRGAGAAILAPYQREQQQKELALQQQQVGSQSALQGAEAQKAQSQSQMVTLPNGVMVPPQVYASMMNTGANVAGRENVAQTNAGARTGAATISATAAGARQDKTDAQKQKSLDQQYSEFQQTKTYNTWKTNQDNETKKQIATMTGGKAPAALVQTAVFAKGGLSMLDDAKQAMQQLQSSGVMGSLPANKVQDWIFGKGLVDPRLDPATRQAIGKLRSALTFTSSAAMRAHTGRTSQEIYEDFKNTLGPGQDWSALNGAIQETEKMLGQYSTAASDENMKSIRSGGSSGAATGGKVNLSGAPDASNFADGYQLKRSGAVIATAKGGKWVTQ